jgi:paraquat-inducible protein A
MTEQHRTIKSHTTIACYNCDLLVRLPETISPNHRVCCPRCHHNITSGEYRSDQYLAALSLTALIVFIVANSFDFLIFTAQGQDLNISLAAASIELWVREFFVLGGLVMTFIILLPALYLSGLFLLLVPSRWFNKPSRRKFFGRLMSALLPWAMADVFLVGVLVALIKIVSIAEISFGLGFWSYVLFTGIFLHLTIIMDRIRLWRLVDRQPTTSATQTALTHPQTSQRSA